MKQALYFLGGAFFTAVFVFLSPGKPAILLVLGALLALASVAAAVWIAGIPRIVRLLNSLGNAQTPPVERSKEVRAAHRGETKTKGPVIVDRSGYKKPSTKQRDRDFAADLEFMREEDEEFFTAQSRRAS